MSDYIRRDENGNNYIHIFNDGCNKGEICMYTNGFHYSYDVLTNRYYRLEHSSSLRANYQSELIKKRISKKLFYEIMEDIKNICKKEEEENNRIYKNRMMVKCKNIFGGKAIKCRIINSNYDYGYIEVKILEGFTGHAVVKKEDVIFMNQFMEHEGNFTNLEKKKIVIKSIVDRIVKNFLNAELNNEIKLMSYYSKKLYNFLKKYKFEILHKEATWTNALLKDISTFYINENIKIDEETEGSKTKNWEYVVKNYTKYKNKMELIMNYRCPTYYDDAILDESKFDENGCTMSCRDCWDLEIKRGYMFCRRCGEHGVFELEEHNCHSCKERGLFEVDKFTYYRTEYRKY